MNTNDLARMMVDWRYMPAREFLQKYPDYQASLEAKKEMGWEGYEASIFVFVDNAELALADPQQDPHP